MYISLNSSLYVIFQKHTNNLLVGMENVKLSTTNALVKKEREFGKMIIIIIVLFFATYFPTFVLRAVSIELQQTHRICKFGLKYFSLCPGSERRLVIFYFQVDSHASKTKTMASVLFQIINSCSVIIDPVVYIIYHKKYRKAIDQVLGSFRNSRRQSTTSTRKSTLLIQATRKKSGSLKVHVPSTLQFTCIVKFLIKLNLYNC